MRPPEAASTPEHDGATHAQEQLAKMQEQIERGEYSPCSKRVATAILERIGSPFYEEQPLRELAGGRALLQALGRPRGA